MQAPQQQNGNNGSYVVSCMFRDHICHDMHARMTYMGTCCPRTLARTGLHLGPGFARVLVLRRHCLRTLKAEYRARYCDPLHPAYPKLIEVRSRKEIPTPSAGDYLEIEGLCGAIVKQVGEFHGMDAWRRFPLKAAGGIALDHPDDIHSIPGMSPADFELGQVWWAVLEFPF